DADLRRDPRDVCVGGRLLGAADEGAKTDRGHQREEARADANEDVRPKSRPLLAELALDPHGCAEARGDEQTHRDGAIADHMVLLPRYLQDPPGPYQVRVDEPLAGSHHLAPVQPPDLAPAHRLAQGALADRPQGVAAVAANDRRRED